MLQKYDVPYAVYIAAEFADGVGHLWWHHLESIIAQNDRLDIDGCRIDCASVPEKQSAFARLEEMFVSQADHSEERAFVHRFAARHDYDPTASARSLCMDWDEIREISADPLATIGAHTISHPMLAKIPETQVRTESARSRCILEENLQRDVAHLAYPYGTTDAVGPREFKIAAEAGYQTAITTYPEVLGAADGSRLLQLPRLNVDGNYQGERYLDVLLSGVTSAVWNKMRGLRDLYAGVKAPTMGEHAA